MNAVNTKVKNFTTTLSPAVIAWLDGVAKETKQHKNDIIESALTLWKREYTQRKIAKSYENAMSDPEWVLFGNTGLEDWRNVE